MVLSIRIEYLLRTIKLFATLSFQIHMASVAVCCLIHQTSTGFYNKNMLNFISVFMSLTLLNTV